VITGSYPEERDEGRTPWAVILALIVVAAVLRAIGLNRDLWLDEIYTLVRTVRHPLREILTIFPGDNQHMFYSVLARISVVLFGEQPWTLRLPSLLFGVGAVPALYFLAREVTTQRESLLAATLMTVSYHHVWFSQNARGYTGMLFWTLICTTYLLRGMRSPKWSNWVIYGIAAALGTYTYLMMVLVVLAHAAICTFLRFFPSKKERYRIISWKQPAATMALAGILTLLLYAPVLLQMKQFFNQPSKMQGVSTPMWALLETLRGLQIGFGSAAALGVAGALFVVGLCSYWRESGVAAALFILPGVATAAGAIAARGTMYPRFYFYLLGFGLLILVRGAMAAVSALTDKLSYKPERRAIGIKCGTALVALMIAASCVSLIRNYRYPKQDFSGALRLVETQQQPGEPVVTTGAIGYVYREYFGLNWAQVSSVSQLAAIRSSGRRVWAVYTFPRYVERETPELFAAIQSECTAKYVLPGTVGGGEIVACVLEADRKQQNANQ
jgi:mannosyltransferase